MEVIHKIGRRKNAVARVYIAKGKGNITINKREFENYFTTGTLQYKVMQPLALTDNAKSFDITVNVHGGGTTGQAEAIRLAISRAMCELNEENRGILKVVQYFLDLYLSLKKQNKYFYYRITL